MNRKYSLSEYDANWINKFETVKKLVLEIFVDKVVQIEHIGSTSVSGMKAKPLIDVLVIVKNVHDISKEATDMKNVGYDVSENYIAPDTFMFFKTNSDGEKLENIHVCEMNSPKVRQFLVTRDYLRAFPNKAKQYSDLKELNFKKHPDDYIAYRSAKAEFLAQLEREAYEWEEKKYVKND